MVLRFDCPGCRAPYSVADQFAGRTLQCTQCGTAIQIGAPAPPPPPPQGAGLMGSMEWSGEDVRPAPPPARKPQASPSLDLLPDDDDPGFQEDEDDAEEEPPKRSKRGSRGSRSDAHMVEEVAGRAKRRASSRQGRTSSRQAKQSSRLGRKSTGGGPVSRDCPVCDEEIAAIAESCPHCGARLRAPSVASQLPKQLLQLAGPLLALGLLGGGGYFLYVTFTKEEKKVVQVKTRKTRKRPSSGEEPKSEGPKSEDPQSGEPKSGEPKSGEPKSEEPKSGEPKSGDPKSGGERPAAKTEDPRPEASPEERRPDTPTESVGGNVIPEGPHKEAFKRLLDAASGAPGREAVLALAKLDAAVAVPLLEAASQSDDARYRLRIHRVLLRLGDAAAQKAACEASIKSHTGAKLFWTALTALELDPEGQRGALLQLGYDDKTGAARAIADAVLDGGGVSSNLVGAIRALSEGGDQELSEALAPILVLAGGVEALGQAAADLDHPNPVVKKLARRALVHISAGQGPAEGASAGEWKAWVARYEPIRALLAQASKDLGGMPDVPGSIARNKALQQLIAKGGEALAGLPIFLREPASKQELAGRMVGALICAVASRSDKELLEAILVAVESHDESATHVIAAVMCVGDTDVAEAAAKAVIAAGIPTRRWDEFPGLARVPSEAAVQAIVDWAEGRMEQERHQAYLLAAAFRSPRMAQNLIEGRSLKGLKVGEIVARLGSPQIDEALVEVLRGERPRALDAQSVQDATRLLSEGGTEEGCLKGLLKTIEERKIENHQIAKALSAVASPKSVRRLKKVLEGWTNGTMELAIQRAYGEIGGEKCVDDLAKLYKKLDESKRRGLERVLLDLGSKSARDIAAKPFESLKAQAWREGISFGQEQFERLIRCGNTADGELLVEYVREGRPSKLNMSRCLSGIGVMGYKPGLKQVVSFIHQNHADRSNAAASAALLGGGQEDMQTVMASKEVLARVKGEDFDVLAALAVLDPAAAGEAAKPFVEKVAGQTSDYRAVQGLAFALTIAGNDEALLRLADFNDRTARAAVARGIAWAAISRKERPPYPTALDLLSADPEPLVRAEAAIGRAYFDKKEAAQEIARTLPLLSEAELSLDRLNASALVALCNGESIRTLRANLWHAHSVAGGKTPPFRSGLGQGRIWEVEREMR